MNEREAANHPMQPSGEVGRFEVDDQPSPPADRYRSPRQRIVLLLTALNDQWT